MEGIVVLAFFIVAILFCLPLLVAIKVYYLSNRIHELENRIYDLKKELLKKADKTDQNSKIYAPKVDEGKIVSPVSVISPHQNELIQKSPESVVNEPLTKTAAMAEVDSSPQMPFASPTRLVKPSEEIQANVEQKTTEPVTAGDFTRRIPGETAGPAKIEKPEMDLETRIGAVWFNRIGLVVLVIGFVLMGRYITPHLLPWHKVVLCYLGAAVLYGAGWRFETHLKIFARPVMAGGLALAFFTAFASHFVLPMACLGLWASLLLMTLSTGGIFFCAERWRSESTAGLAIFLGHVTAFVASGDADTFSLIAILFLSVAAIVLFLRHNWMPLSVFAVCAAYGSHVLWAVQKHPPSTPEFGFWVNFIFLSSYYAIFLFADLMYRFRFWKQGKDAFTPQQQMAGRFLGPVSLILYSLSTAGLFFATGVYLDQMYYYLISLALLQSVLVLYQRSRQNPDFPFYAAMAAIFFTAGLFSLFGGMTLNLALALEALILLTVARQMDLWFLNPLAQCVLTFAFMHYWCSGAHTIKTWPQFAGSLAIASVYFVQSRMEETWPSKRNEDTAWQAAWTKPVQDYFAKAFTPLSYIHAVLGAVLISFQCNRFLLLPFPETMITFFIAGFSVLVWRLISHPLIFSIWFYRSPCFLSCLINLNWMVVVYGMPGFLNI